MAKKPAERDEDQHPNGLQEAKRALRGAPLQCLTEVETMGETKQTSLGRLKSLTLENHKPWPALADKIIQVDNFCDASASSDYKARQGVGACVNKHMTPKLGSESLQEKIPADCSK